MIEEKARTAGRSALNPERIAAFDQDLNSASTLAIESIFLAAGGCPIRLPPDKRRAAQARASVLLRTRRSELPGTNDAVTAAAAQIYLYASDMVPLKQLSVADARLIIAGIFLGAAMSPRVSGGHSCRAALQQRALSLLAGPCQCQPVQ